MLDPTLGNTFSAVEIHRSICERLYPFDARSHIFPSPRSSGCSPIPARVLDIADGATHNSREFSGDFDVDANAFTGSPAIDRKRVPVPRHQRLAQLPRQRA